MTEIEHFGNERFRVVSSIDTALIVGSLQYYSPIE